MPVELTMLSRVTSSPFCLKMPASSASHSGRLSAIRLLYETCSATAGPTAAAAAVGLVTGALVGAAIVGAGAVVAAGLAGAACVGAGAAGAAWHAAKNIPTPANRAAHRIVME